MRAVFASGLSANVRARVQLLRARAATGLDVTCGGVSMEPVIARGAAVSVWPGRPDVGQIAAFVTPRGELELHRLILRSPGLPWWVHAGDNQAAPHLGLVHDDQIVGVVPGRGQPPTTALQARALARLALAGLRWARRRVIRGSDDRSR
jgi:hypothetical protein